jgi:hypothetical protein
MADKRISQLIERTDIANNDVLPIVASGATTTNKVTVSTLQDWMQDNLDVGVTSVGLSVPSAFTVSGSPVTTSGNITISGAGTTAQYIRGDGSLADFPSSIGGGGASVSYYLNGSVSQGTIGGVAYLELSKSPILGSGTDFTINADGYIASFITDAGDPSLLEIPGGNWNFETYFQASSGGGTPSFYVELYKVSSGGTATLIATSSGSPELIAFGTNTTPYFSSLAVPTTTLALTDRLAIRYYVAHSGRTITLHTENNTLCQIITTFTTGLTALNGLTAQVQNFATGTSGTDFNISSASTTHTFNLPDASASNRGAVTTGSQVFGGVKTFANGLSLPSAGGSNQVTRLVNIGTLHEGSATLNQIGFNSANNIYFGKGLSNGGVLQWTNSAVRYYTLPDADGTLALASQLGAYLPLAGGTLTGALNGTSAVFSGDVQSGTRLIAAASSQSILLTPNSGGSTNRVESVGTLPLALVSAAAITMAAGGTTPQITLTTAGNVAIGTGSVTGAINADSLRANLILGAANSNKISFNNGSTTETGFIYNDPSETAIGYPSAGSFKIQRVGVGSVLTLASTGAATFSSSVTATQGVFNGSGTNDLLYLDAGINTDFAFKIVSGSNDVLTLRRQHATLGNLDIISYGFNGNVGIGTASPSGRLHVQNGVSGQTISNITNLVLENNGTANDFYVFQTATAGGGKSFSITNAGNVGIGTASPTRPLEIYRAGSSTAQMRIGDASVSKGYFGVFSNSLYITQGGVFDGSWATDGSNGISNIVLETTNGGSSIAFGTASSNTFPTERMRITSGGYLKATSDGTYVASGSNFHEMTATANGTNLILFRHKGTDPYGLEISFSGATPNNSTNWFQYFQDASAARFIVRSNGGLQNYQANDGNLSDERTKKDIEPLESYWDKFKAIEIVKFKYKDQTHDDFNIGVIAQQVEAVAPEFVDVDGWGKPELDEEGNEIVSEEEPLKSIYTADLYHATIKVLQEAMAKIEKLEAEIDSLKTK